MKVVNGRVKSPARFLLWIPSLPAITLRSVNQTKKMSLRAKATGNRTRRVRIYFFVILKEVKNLFSLAVIFRLFAPLRVTTFLLSFCPKSKLRMNEVTGICTRRVRIYFFCHSERSEESVFPGGYLQTLRSAQSDNFSSVILSEEQTACERSGRELYP